MDQEAGMKMIAVRWKASVFEEVFHLVTESTTIQSETVEAITENVIGYVTTACDSPVPRKVHNHCPLIYWWNDNSTRSVTG